MTVNGQVSTISVEPRTTLLDAVRDELGRPDAYLIFEVGSAWTKP
jgi:aerobic-type carbon monoxide dehydrogenase small subunit (CoxS/CutS family)